MDDDIKEHYSKFLREHGPSPQPVQWSSKQSQYRRFEVLSAVSVALKTVVDIGCGIGDMLHHLIQSDFNGRHLGLDYVEEYIDFACERLFDNKQASFEYFYLRTNDIPFFIMKGKTSCFIAAMVMETLDLGMQPYEGISF